MARRELLFDLWETPVRRLYLQPRLKKRLSRDVLCFGGFFAIPSLMESVLSLLCLSAAATEFFFRGGPGPCSAYTFSFSSNRVSSPPYLRGSQTIFQFRREKSSINIFVSHRGRTGVPGSVRVGETGGLVGGNSEASSVSTHTEREARVAFPFLCFLFPRVAVFFSCVCFCQEQS